VKSYFNLGRAYENLKCYSRAIEYYNTVIVLKPDFAESYYNLARVYDELKYYSLSAEYYEKTLELNPKDEYASNNLAWIYATTRDPNLYKPTRALELATKAVEIDRNPDYLDTLAIAYAATGDFNQAILVQKQAIELTEEPQEKDVWLRQIQGYENAKDYRQQQKKSETAF
jgi:tetratricopeptide (TPR) repeat protein